MSKKKSIIEEAILEAKEIEKAVMENAKEILSKSTKEDIEEMVKESLVTEEDDDDESEADGNAESTASELPTDDEITSDETGDDVGGSEMGADMDVDTEIGADMDDTGLGGDDVMDMTGASDADVIKVFKKIDGDAEVSVTKDADGTIHLDDGANEYRIEVSDDMDLGSDMDMGGLDSGLDSGLGGEEELGDDAGMDDMGGESEELAPIEGAEEDDDTMFGEGEEKIYEVELAEEDPVMGDGAGNGPETDSDEGFEEDKGEVIPFKGKPMKSPVSGNVVPVSEEEEKVDDETIDEEEMDETTARTHSVGRYGMRKLPETFPDDRKRPAQRTEALKRSYVKLVNENKELRKNISQFKKLNEDYKKALNHFKGKLNEVAVFNTNLFYATQLFTEHSTTKDEKLHILKRFDNIKSVKESKNLYNVIKGELSDKTPIKEKVEDKISKPVGSGANKQPIVESTIYKDSQFNRTLELMSKIS